MPPNIFSSSSPATKAVVTLILIENSQGMLTVWNDLRQHYLPTLLGSMRMANPVVPVRTSLLYPPLCPKLCSDTRSVAHHRTRR